MNPDILNESSTLAAEDEEPRVSPEVRLTSHKSTYSLGSNITLRCEVTGYYPEHIVEWHKDGVRLEPRDRVKILGNHTIQIALSEASDSGLYGCVAIVEARKYTSTTVSVEVEIPKVHLTSDQATYSLGTDIALRCEVTGYYPEPTVEWNKDGVSLELMGRVNYLGNHIIQISRAEASDSGCYGCDAITEAGRETSTTSVSVTVEEGVFLHPNCTDNRYFANCSSSNLASAPTNTMRAFAVTLARWQDNCLDQSFIG